MKSEKHVFWFLKSVWTLLDIFWILNTFKSDWKAKVLDRWRLVIKLKFGLNVLFCSKTVNLICQACVYSPNFVFSPVVFKLTKNQTVNHPTIFDTQIIRLIQLCKVTQRQTVQTQFKGSFVQTVFSSSKRNFIIIKLI